MQELYEELKKLLQRVKDLEAAFTRIKTLIFPTDSGKLVIPKYTSDPASPQNGEVWYNTTSNTFKCYQNGAVKTFTTS